MDRISPQPDQTTLQLHRVHIYLVVFLFLLAVTARVLPGPRTIDDSFITYRYARNILAGNGFVYNPDERVLGTTTPFYTILLTVLGSISGGVNAPFPNIALILNALADGIVCILLYLLGKKLRSPIAGLGAGLAWAIAPYSVTFSIGGLETSVFVLLIVSITYCYLVGWFIPAALLSALALLTRPDAILLVGPLILDRCIQYYRLFKPGYEDNVSNDIPIVQKQKVIRELLGEMCVFVIPLLLWGIFSMVYFGNPIPHSIAAKSVAYRLPADAAFTRLLQHYATPFMDNLTFGVSGIGIGLVLYPFLYLVGSLHSVRFTSRIWPFLLYPWLYFLVYSIANPLIFRWYLTPPLTALFLVILIGADQTIQRLAGWISKKLFKRKDIPRSTLSSGVSIVFVVIIPCLMLSRGWTSHPDHGLSRPAPLMAWYNLELFYKKAADQLIDDLKNDDAQPLLAAGDVGVLGYFTGMRILDTVGLNSTQSVKYYPADPSYYIINYAIPPDLILDLKPDIIVILEIYGRGGLIKDERFQEFYHLRNKIPTDIYGSDGMLIYERSNQ
jgi:hypothetical protein